MKNLKFIKKIAYQDIICGMFKMSDLFDIKTGKGIITNEGEYPLVSSTRKNNGISGKSKQSPYENSYTTSVDCGAITYWHPYKFDTTQKILILKPKFKIENNNVMNMIARFITSYLYPRYNYSVKANLTAISNQYIPLPIKDNKVDIKFLESFYLEHKEKFKNNIKDKVNNKLEALGQDFIDPEINLTPIKKIVYQDQICGMFRLSDLFDFITSKSKAIDTHGEYPLITGSARNNGRTGTIEKCNFENVFSLIQVWDGAGTCFWHPYKFWLGDNAMVAIPKFKIGDNITMNVLAASITCYLNPRYGVGNPCKIIALKDQLIPLPIKDNRIDFKGMHDSYKAIIKENINKVLEKIDKI